MFAYFTAVLSLSSIVLCDFYLKIIHNNDIHSRFDEERCPKDRTAMCGGIAKQISLIKSERSKPSNFEKLVLNAGDIFQGSLWYIVGGWEICAEIMNVMKPDVQCLGNHEFDKGLDELESYVTACEFPTIGGNVDFSKHPSLVDKIKKSIVITKGGQKIGIIGYVTREAAFTSRPGVAIFEDEISALTKESKRLHNEGVKFIIALGHSGEKIDKQIARKVPHVDIVVGSHDHILYYNKQDPPGREKISGKYPTIEEREVNEKENSKQVPIVTAFAFSKYIGVILLTFNDDGKLLDFQGDVKYCSAEEKGDPEARKILEKYRPRMTNLTRTRLGFTLVNFVCHNRRCRNYECNCGNLLVDAFVLYRAAHGPKKKWTDAPLGIMNAGSILLKSNFTESYFTKGDLLQVFPNQNQIVIIKLKGKHLKEALEHGVSGNLNDTSHYGEFLQVSGIRFEVDFSKAKGERVSTIRVRCGECSVPKYTILNTASTYSIVTTEFLASGADGHNAIKDHTISTEYLNVYDEEAVTWYFENHNPMYAERSHRIILIRGGRKSCEERLQPIANSILLFVAFCSYYL